MAAQADNSLRRDNCLKQIIKAEIMHLRLRMFFVTAKNRWIKKLTFALYNVPYEKFARQCFIFPEREDAKECMYIRTSDRSFMFRH